MIRKTMRLLGTITLALGCLAVFSSCDRHNWEASTSALFEEHGHGHADSHEAEGDHAPSGDHGKDDHDTHGAVDTHKEEKTHSTEEKKADH